MSLKLGDISFLTDRSYSLYAHFKSVSGLKAGNRVELYGIQIGSVSGYVVDQEKQFAVVKLKIREKIKIYEDAVATIQTDGLLGDRFVNIKTEAKGKRLESGEVIETSESSFEELAKEIKSLPIKEIFETLLSVLRGIDKLVNSPVLEKSIIDVNEAIHDFKKMIRNVDSSLDRFMAGFDNTENSLQNVLVNINQEIEPVASDIKVAAKAARRALRQA
jgi:phospholipid/cholesterol/gamma-HCH transport system substrate-binding protein